MKNKPTLLFDGACLFCRRFIRRWAKLTGDSVNYEPYQTSKKIPASIKKPALDQAVHFIEPDGNIRKGAAAVFRTMAYARGHEWLDDLYVRSAATRAISEMIYSGVARWRNMLSKTMNLLWGGGFNDKSYALGTSLFLRALGIIFALAFGSLSLQILGLFGEKGIYPANTFLQMITSEVGTDAALYLPSVLWLNSSDFALRAVCLSGTVLGIMITLGVAMGPLILICTALYLSLISIGGEFMRYQWDSLLVECGFLAMLVAPWCRILPRRSLNVFTVKPARILILLLWFLLFRIMLGAAVVKYNSGDTSWRDLTALAFHYFTQPLPNGLSWYAHQLPLWFQKFCAGGMFIVEGLLPLFIFLPRNLRHLSALGFFVLQILIICTGNYGFFNWLMLALCFTLIDDRAWRRVLGRLRLSRLPLPQGFRKWSAVGAALFIFPTGLFILDQQIFGPPGHLGSFRQLSLLAQSYSVVNPYGLFAVMTKERREIEIEGTADGKTWTPYVFRYKPGPLDRRPPFVAPYHPRLDWQMWFAALDQDIVPEPHKRQPRRISPVLRNLSIRLLEGAEPVLALFQANPFKDAPPRKLRFTIYQYKFAKSGPIYWERIPLGRFIVDPRSK